MKQDRPLKIRVYWWWSQLSFSDTLSKDGSVAEGWKHPADKVT